MTQAENTTTTNARPLASRPDMTPTMSSRDIADLTDKRHDNVMRDIRKMLVELHGEGGLLRFEDTQLNPQNGQPYSIFRLPRRETMILMMGYSIALRAKVHDRWEELEAQASDPNAAILRALSDPAAMRGILLGYTEKVMKLEVENARLKPAAEALDRIAESYGAFCRSTAAKMLQTQPHTLIRWMRTNGWTFRRPGDKDDLAYQSKIAAGLLEHKITTGQKPDGSDWSSTQVRVTPKGIAVLAKAFSPAAKAA